MMCLLKTNLSSFTTDTSCQLDVLRHDRNSLGVNRAQVGILKQADQVAFASFLQSHDSGALESEISLEVLGNFSYESSRWKGNFLISNSVDFWYRLISLRATVPGLYR